MAKELRYTAKLGRAVAKKARVSNHGKRYHVVSSFNTSGWSVVQEGTVRTIKGFGTKQAAISYARKSNDLISQVVVHGKDGRIQNIIALNSK